MKRQLFVLLTVFVVSNIALSTLIISLSNKAQRQRVANSELLYQQQIMTQQAAVTVKSFECILLIEPVDRTPENVESCKQKAAIEVGLP